MKFIPATSCNAERLFGSARWVLIELRQRMSPMICEAVFFLKRNRPLWNIKTVVEAIKSFHTPLIENLDCDEFYD